MSDIHKFIKDKNQFFSSVAETFDKFKTDTLPNELLVAVTEESALQIAQDNIKKEQDAIQSVIDTLDWDFFQFEQENFKLNYFGQLSDESQLDETKLVLEKRQVKYRLVIKNKTLFDLEFQQSYKSLKNLDNTAKKASIEQWLFLYYCCLMLRLFYEGYEQTDKAKDFTKLALEIRARCINGEFPKSTKRNLSFLQYLSELVSESLASIAQLPYHLADMRRKLSFANICRLYWIFSRLMLTSAFQFARNIKVFDKLDAVLGIHVDADKIVAALNAPNNVFRGLSVGVFITRIIMNTASLLKHTFNKTATFEENAVNWVDRVWFELKKRHADYLNDIVWAVINGITNYNEFFHISAAAAGWITAGFLFFDVMLLAWRDHLAELDYIEKRTQYEIEMKTYDERLLLDPHSIFDLKQKALLEEQLHELMLFRAAQRDTGQFNILAALFLFSGFTAALVFTPVGAMALCYAVSTLAAAMYLSDGAYHGYADASNRLIDARDFRLLSGVELESYELAFAKARNEYYFTLLRNLILPALTVASFAIFWPAGIVVVVTYICIELVLANKKNKELNNEELAFVEEELGDDLKDTLLSLIQPSQEADKSVAHEASMIV